MNITYRVLLTAAERDYLEAFTSQDNTQDNKILASKAIIPYNIG